MLYVSLTRHSSQCYVPDALNEKDLAYVGIGKNAAKERHLRSDGFVLKFGIPTQMDVEGCMARVFRLPLS